MDRLLENVDVELAPQSEAAADVVVGTAWIHLVQEPQPLLSRGHWQLTGPGNPADGICDLVLRCRSLQSRNNVVASRSYLGLQFVVQRAAWSVDAQAITVQRQADVALQNFIKKPPDVINRMFYNPRGFARLSQGDVWIAERGVDDRNKAIS